MLEEQSPENNDISGKVFVSTGRTYASPEWDGIRCPEEQASPICMSHLSQILYGNFS